MEKSKVKMGLLVLLAVMVLVFIGFYTSNSPDYDAFKEISSLPSISIDLYKQYPQRKKIYDKVDSLGLNFLDSNNDGWTNKIVNNGKEIFESEYYILSTYIDQNYLVTITGLNSFDVGGFRYFIFPHYTQIVVFDINQDYKIVLNKTFKPVIGNAIVKNGDLIFAYGSEENPKYGKLEIE